jgi:hypothetical protein
MIKGKKLTIFSTLCSLLKISSLNITRIIINNNQPKNLEHYIDANYPISNQNNQNKNIMLSIINNIS